MAEKNWIQQAVERVVSQILESHIPYLRDDLVRRVLQELQPVLAGGPEASPRNLLKSISGIHEATSQRDILTALLDHAARYCGRTALFVVRAGAAVGWQARTFPNNEAVRNFSLDVAGGIAARALQERKTASGSVRDMDQRFMSAFGPPAEDAALMLPLALKDRVAALLYADGGSQTGNKLDAAALEVLVISTGTWLEVVSLRRGVAAPGSTREAASEQVVEPPPAPVLPPPPPPPPSRRADPEAPVPAPARAGAAAEPEPEMAGLSPEDAEVHRKARRFAKLLIDEIKLYNQGKVAEGRKHKDLYDRLKDDIEKSRATYEKRYGQTVAAGADYFHQELVRSLAEDDSSLLGSNFHR